MPCLFTDSAARKASSISRPATKRALSFLPREERSEKLRKERLRERAIKAERKTGINRPFRHTVVTAMSAGDFSFAYALSVKGTAMTANATPTTAKARHVAPNAK